MNNSSIENKLLQSTLTNTRQALLNARNAEGIWPGHLSSSPLATAVAVFALRTVDSDKHDDLIRAGLAWLAEHQQDDGSWGDAEKLDPGNISTTLLCYVAFSAIDPDTYLEALEKTKDWLTKHVGDLTPQAISQVVYAVYGKDRTFAVPILTMCALAGLLGEDGWRFVKPLPFELAVLPRALFRWLKLTVVSYALPALIAMGQAKYYYDKPANLLTRLLRKVTQKTTLKLLEKIQPSSGGFLEATPLTSFVVMSLASMGQGENPVVLKGLDFITHSVRGDGSWPIDTNLSTWVTSLSVEALLQSGCEEVLSEPEKEAICDWYLSQQFRTVHPYTGARPGGWGWTNLPGSVPDADDTAGALVALHRLNIRKKVRKDFLPIPVFKAIRWLLDLQNADGGLPTFCRGWGKMEFDRSCPDITAHAIMAWQLWKGKVSRKLAGQMARAIERGLSYLSAAQREDGSWLPLWFGNPSSASRANPVYGTAKVVRVLSLFEKDARCAAMLKRGADFLIQSQNDDSGWGSEKGADSTIEETSLAVDALLQSQRPLAKGKLDSAFNWLIDHTGQGIHFSAAPIGLYFAKLWYAERLYPVIFTLGAFQKRISSVS